MIRLILLLKATALCIFVLANQTTGSQSCSTMQGVIDLGQDFVFGQGKQNRTNLKANSWGTTGEGSDPNKRKYVVALQTPITVTHDNYYGASVTMDVYGHDLKAGQLTATVIWVRHLGNGRQSTYNSIQAGWHINPERYGDSRPHLFAYWTRDGHLTTGCCNMDCPGFVQANGAAVSLGSAIGPVSDVHGGPRQKITIQVLKDKTSGDWWVYYGFNGVPTAVGYYPKSLFPYLAYKANNIAFGANVITNRALPTPPMGSGVFPDGHDNAHTASISDVHHVHEDRMGNLTRIKLLNGAPCYAITQYDHNANKCFYGGPGGCVS